MQCIRKIFVFETVNCFLDVFFKSPKLFSILHIPDNSIISVKLYFVKYGFLLRPGHQYTRGEGGQGKNPSEGKNRNERHKSSENQKK